jgi:tRNA(Ile)-lysidine synthase
MLKEKVRENIKKYALFTKDETVILGVSGGPDSVAMLYLLKELSPELKIKLHIAHFDHGLRKDSGKDREFVENLALKLKIPFTYLRKGIEKVNRRGSIEEIARNERLKFFFDLADKLKAQKIALAHNLDDQAETVLMRILRGTGLYGLSAISPKRKILRYEVVRPLIEIKRSEIEAFLRKRKLNFRRDYTNFQDLYFRNRIRNKLMPLLEKKYNSNIKEILSNTAQSLSYDYDYLLRAAERFLKINQGALNLKKVERLHPAILRLILRLKFAEISGNMRRLTFKHVEELEDLIFNRPLNSIVSLPKGILALKKRAKLVFRHK